VKLTRERKIFLGLLGLGAAALAVDRVFLGPAGASAAVGETPSAKAVAAAPAPAPVRPEKRATGPSLAQRLRGATTRLDASSTKDAFKPSSAWGVTPAKVPAAASEDAQTFQATHHITSILQAGDQAIVMIKGKTYRVGEVVDGYRVVEIRTRSAVFQGNGPAFEVSLPEPKVEMSVNGRDR
jgi:hypothetical protein